MRLLYALIDITVAAYVCICSVNRSLDPLLHKWNLKCENVSLSRFNSVQAFDSATGSEYQNDERSFQMMVISRPNK